MARTLLLVTIGTLGDLHPFIALALALRDRGFRPVMAVPQDHVAKCIAAGFEAEAVLPGLDSVGQSMGLDHAEAVRRLIGSQRLMMDRVLIPGLSDCVAALDRLAGEADAVIGSVFAFAAAIVAERRGLPLVSIVLQPMAMLSALDPPTTPDFWMMRHGRVGPVGAAWNRLAYRALRSILDRLYGRRVDTVRVAYGLPRAGARHLLEAPRRSVLRLGCYSPQLAPLPRDATQRTRIVGFPCFDSESGRDEPLPPSLSEFLAEGEPPLVFTLGTFAVVGATRFYEQAREAATRLGRRAVLLVGDDAPPCRMGDVFLCGYARHSLLFPAAAVIVHHGGVGTTGQAMRAGRPQVVVPHMGDQNDHAARITRMGLGLRLGADRITAARLERALATVLDDPDYATRAAVVAQRMVGEDGAECAADAIVEALGR